MRTNDETRELGRQVQRLLGEAHLAKTIREATNQAQQMLALDAASPGAAVPILLEAFGKRLPRELRACRLSVMRGGTAYHVERHPNAAQYVYSLANDGTISVWNGNLWQASELTSDPDAPLTARWHAIPADTWHQPTPGRRDWVVLGFHTVTADRLVDDYEFEVPPRTG